MENTEAGPAEKETESVVRSAEMEIECTEPGPDEEEIESVAEPAEKIQSREPGPAEGEVERQNQMRRSQIFNYFARAQSKDLTLFFQYHPQQTPRRVLPNIFYSRDGINRKWLTYCEESHSLFCSPFGIFKALRL